MNALNSKQKPDKWQTSRLEYQNVNSKVIPGNETIRWRELKN